MKKNHSVRTVIIIGAVVLAILAVAAALLLVMENRGEKAYEKQIAVAEQYLAAGDVNMAISAYYSAIDLDSDKEEAYYGLADIYQRQGELTLLNYILGRGYEQTGKAGFLTRLNNLETILLEEKENQEETIILNDALLTRLANFTSDDYSAAYGAGITSGIGGQVTMTSANVCVTYEEAGLEIYSNQGGNSTDYPEEIHLITLQVLFTGLERSATYTQLSALGLTGLSIVNLNGIGTAVSFQANGCQIYIACDSDGTVTDGAWNCILLPVIAGGESEEEEPTVLASLSGYINDATTGAGVRDVNVRLYQNGILLQQVTTDYRGAYYLENLEGGNYSLELIADGYITGEESVYIGQWITNMTENFVLSPELGTGQIRIVLTWGATPQDLDSYLELEETNEYVFFGNSRVMRNGSVVAELDVDDRDGYGPETTTIYDINGTYHFMVEDFNNTGLIGASGAEVKIYTDDQTAPTVIQIDPSITAGWDVCMITNGTITVLNREISSVRNW